jgi:hypothetical protein
MQARLSARGALGPPRRAAASPRGRARYGLCAAGGGDSPRCARSRGARLVAAGRFCRSRSDVCGRGARKPRPQYGVLGVSYQSRWFNFPAPLPDSLPAYDFALFPTLPLKGLGILRHRGPAAGSPARFPSPIPLCSRAGEPKPWEREPRTKSLQQAEMGRGRRAGGRCAKGVESCIRASPPVPLECKA